MRAVGDEPLPGYRLIAPLGMGGFGEVWKCLAPGGLHKAIKFVHQDIGDENPGEPTSLEQEYEAFERVKSIRHPFLLTLERVEMLDGELVMVMELADQSLGNRYDECRESGLPGIPRSELLSYMVDAAEALDVLGRQHGLQHLDVKPANLFLLGGHVKVGDYGLVARHKANHLGDEPKLGRGLTPKYVAPEILCDRVDARSDQYPLALVYQELLTGVFPFSGRTARQLLLQHSSAEPDLTPLPENDRETVRRALAKDPANRFTSCLSFVKSLLREDGGSGTKIVSTTTRQLPPAPHMMPESPAPKSGISAILVTPAARKSGILNVESTQRYNPADTLVPGERGPSEHELLFNRQHPGWSYIAEWQSTPRGRVVRITDAAGDFHFVHLAKVPPESAEECEPVLTALKEPAKGVFQSAMRPHLGGLSIAVPENCPTLKEWLAKRKTSDDYSPQRRAEVRALLAPVAAALDDMHAKHGFAHGLLSPTTILQKGTAWGTALYGLGELLRRSRADQDWIANEVYAAPEAQQGRAVPASDQYSLALLFLELSGAWAPPDRRGNRPERGSAGFRINRDVLVDCELVAVKKAMAPKPEQRFRNCAEFLAALEPPATKGVVLEEVRAVECVNRLSGRGEPKLPPTQPERLANAVLLAAGAEAVASWPSQKSESLVVRLPDGRMTCRFPVKLTNDLAVLKLTAFKDQHRLDMVKWTDNTYAIKPRTGQQPNATPKGVELVVQLPKNDVASAGELVVTGRSVGVKSDEAVIQLIEQFRRTVQNTNERRKASRFRTDLPIRVFPIDDELCVQASIDGKCQDISASGFACVLHNPLTTGHVFVTFPSIPEFAAWALIAQVVRTQPSSGGSVFVAARFVHAGV